MMTFDQILKIANDRKGASVCLILAWIMTADNEIDDDERSMLEQIAGPANLTGHIDDLVAICLTDDVSAILRACKILKRKLNKEASLDFIGLCLTMVLVDKRLVSIENHILRFLVNFFDVPYEVLDAVFLDYTGRKFPRPGDPSSINWWRSHSRPSGSKQTVNNQSPRLIWALSMLELEGDPSQETIKAAYRRLAKIHHPDRFHSLGSEANEAAKIAFQRISDAYQVLSHG